MSRLISLVLLLFVLMLTLVLVSMSSTFADGFGQYDQLFNVQRGCSITEIAAPAAVPSTNYDLVYQSIPGKVSAARIAEVDALLRARLSDSESFQYISYHTNCNYQVCATIHYQYDGLKYNETLGVNFDLPPNPDRPINNADVSLTTMTSVYGSMQITLLQNQLSTLRMSVENLESTVNRKQSEINGLSLKARSLRERFLADQERLRELVAEQERANRALAQTLQTENNLQHVSARLDQMIEASRNEMEQLESENQNLERELSENVAATTQLYRNFTAPEFSSNWIQQGQAIDGHIGSGIGSHNQKVIDINTVTRIQQGFDLVEFNVGDFINRTDFDFQRHVQPHFATPPTHPHYQSLVTAERYLNQTRKEINTSPLYDQKETRNDLLDLAEMSKDLADEDFSRGDDEDGEKRLSLTLTLIDGALSFVPGVSAIKDAITLSTGINPITREAVSDMELAIIGGTFFMPAIFSGTTKAISKTGAIMLKFMGSGKNFGIANKIVTAIRNADTYISSIINKLPTAKIGELTDEIVDSAARLGLKEGSKLNAVLDTFKRFFADEAGHVETKFLMDVLEGGISASWKMTKEVMEDLGSAIKNLRTSNKLPEKYIKKDEAKALGWERQSGNLHEVAPGKSIGGDVYKNMDGQLPVGKKYYEADLGYTQGRRGTERIVYSEDRKFYITNDHYETFTEIKP
ncbi:MAG: hypothetical protein HQK53_07275 [Oligoflexia bacterium]|nr:hypothetical protein [Oligoflexia bacterium]